MMPFHGDAAAAEMLRERLQDWLVTNSVRNDNEVQQAVAKALQQRKDKANGGALSKQETCCSS